MVRVKITPTENRTIDGLGVFTKDEPQEFDRGQIEGFHNIMGVALDGYLPEDWTVEVAVDDDEEVK